MVRVFHSAKKYILENSEILCFKTHRHSPYIELKILMYTCECEGRRVISPSAPPPLLFPSCRTLKSEPGGGRDPLLAQPSFDLSPYGRPPNKHLGAEGCRSATGFQNRSRGGNADVEALNNAGSNLCSFLKNKRSRADHAEP